MSRCFERVKGGNPYCPSIAEFLALTTEQIDFDESYLRFISRGEMKTIAEKWTKKQVGWNCRQMADEKARRLWIKTLKSNVERERKGELGNPEVKQLTDGVVPRRELDDMVRDYQPKTFEAKALADRLQRLKDSK